MIRELGNINVKKKEPPFCYPYSLKARVLLLTHLSRMEVSENIEEGMKSHTHLSHFYIFLDDKKTVVLQDCGLSFISTNCGFGQIRVVKV